MLSLKLREKISIYSENYLKKRNWISNNLIVLNILSFIIGILKLFPLKPSALGNLIGSIQILSIFFTMTFILWIILDREQKFHILPKIKKKGQLYLLTLTLSLALLSITNYIISNSYEATFLHYFFIYILKYGSYFMLYFMGIVFLYQFKDFLRNIQQYSPNSYISAKISRKNYYGKSEDFNSTFQIFLKLLYATVIIFVFACFVLIMIFGRELADHIGAIGLIWGMIGIIIIPNSLFFSFVMISQMLFLTTLISKKLPKIQNITIFTGYIFFFILFMPILVVPNTINYGMIEFSDKFEQDWDEKIPKNLEDSYFMDVPFDLSSYMLGIPADDCKIIQDVQYYKDDEISLTFDVFLPNSDDDQLPGQNSTLIRVHGGYWIAGDKGEANTNQINKYFAAQGYIVFDIQYGLINVIPTEIEIVTVLDSISDSGSNLKGNFTIDDQVKHIGLFTKYLADHVTEYGANLDSVFLSGGSAGGQLISAVGLAMTEGYRSDMFDDSLIIKGIIPYYPAIKLADGIFDGDINFIDPTRLISNKSPPCLIFHGENDGIVNKEFSEDLIDAYVANNNTQCMLYLMPFGGHNAVMNFSGIYNQIFTYFMERFLYIYK